MNKAIEELASAYYLNEVINGDTCDDKDGWTDCFVSGAEAFMQLPLASRLTAEEKERVRAMYSEAQSWLDEKTSFDNPNEQLRLCAVAIQDRLERIFGADFFKEGE